MTPRNSRLGPCYTRVDIEHKDRDSKRSWVTYYEESPPIERILWETLPAKNDTQIERASKKASHVLRHTSQHDPYNFYMDIHRFEKLMGGSGRRRNWRDVDDMIYQLERGSQKPRFQLAYDVQTGYCIGIRIVQGHSGGVNNANLEATGRARVTAEDRSQEERKRHGQQAQNDERAAMAR